MNHEQYIRRMLEIGYSQKVAEGLIRLSKNSSDLALRISNFVPVGDGLYEIWVSDERDNFYRVRGKGTEFLGTLSDAYEYVLRQTRTWRENEARGQRDPGMAARTWATGLRRRSMTRSTRPDLDDVPRLGSGRHLARDDEPDQGTHHR